MLDAFVLLHRGKNAVLVEQHAKRALLTGTVSHGGAFAAVARTDLARLDWYEGRPADELAPSRRRSGREVRRGAASSRRPCCSRTSAVPEGGPLRPPLQGVAWMDDRAAVLGRWRALAPARHALA